MLFIFHGPDDFTRNEKIAELRDAVGDKSVMDLNVTVLEGGDYTLSDIRHYADAMPFMSDKRLVVVTDYISGLGTDLDGFEALVDYLGNLSPTTDLVFVEKSQLSRQHPFLKAGSDLGADVMRFAGPDQNRLQPWIIKRVQDHQASIEPGAAHSLGRLIGPDLRLLNNEIEKLALYVGGQRAIKQADVELLVPYTEDAENFGLANALGQRNARKAFDQLHKLLDEGKHPMGILGSIAAQVRGLLEVKDMAERGLSAPEIANVKGWKNDYAAKMRLREAANFSMARLEEILEMLLDIDTDIKTGRIDSLLALDMLVAKLCAAA